MIALCGGGGFLAFRSDMASGAEAERQFRPKVEAALHATTPEAMNAQFPPAFRSPEAAVKTFHDKIRSKLGRVRSVRLREIVGFRTYRGVPSYDLVTADYEATGDRGALVFRATVRKDGNGPWGLASLNML